jgi:AcrR family transcriptional regulator
VAKVRRVQHRVARPRRRGAELDEAVLDAAKAELLAVGYADFSMDAVAARAGTNKNAIYRRWPSRAALAVAAYRQLVTGDLPLPDTGSLRDDTLELLRRANRVWSSPVGSVQRSLIAGAADDPQLLALIQERSAEAGAALWLTVLGRAVARGEARAEVLHPRVATLAVVLLRNEYVTRGFPAAPDHVLVEIVEEVYLPLIRGRGIVS